jgi:hypothetical protein
MPANTSTITFDVQDCKVYSITSDTASAALPTYGAAVDVPGIQEVSVEPNFVTAELKGDGKVLAKKGRVDRLNFSATYSELSLSVLSTIYGGSVTQAGSGSTETATYKFTGDSLPYFKIEFLVNDLESDLAELAFILYKCQVTGGTIMSGSTDNFGTPSFDAEAILPNADTFGFGSVVFREAASGLAS